MTIDKYLEQRRGWETLIVIGIILIGFAASLGEAWMEHARVGEAFEPYVPIVLETTSHLAILALFPLLIAFDARFPIRIETLKTALPAHLAFSVVFSLLHVTLMYWARVVTFRAIAPERGDYHWHNFLGQWLYEYTKDARTYLVILALIYLYRFILRRIQGEAGFVAESDAGNGAGEPPVSDRFLVKKLGREFLVRMQDIDWIESCGNYVNLHVGGKVYPLRDTMTNINERLVPHGFQRVHRSAIVNLDRVSEIVAFDTGDGQARLRGDMTVPVSRRFKKELRERLG